MGRVTSVTSASHRVVRAPTSALRAITMNVPGVSLRLSPPQAAQVVPLPRPRIYPTRNTPTVSRKLIMAVDGTPVICVVPRARVRSFARRAIMTSARLASLVRLRSVASFALVLPIATSTNLF